MSDICYFSMLALQAMMASERAMIDALDERRDFSVVGFFDGRITRLNNRNFWITY